MMVDFKEKKDATTNPTELGTIVNTKPVNNTKKSFIPLYLEINRKIIKRGT